MKLTRKILSLLALATLVLALGGCDDLVGGDDSDSDSDGTASLSGG